jgi:hypothetical protein
VAGAADFLAALTAGSIPPGLVYVQIDTPLGSAVVDPGASAQDSTTQSILQALGISVTFGFGAAPAPAPGQAQLGENLGTLGLLAAGGVALWLLSRGGGRAKKPIATRGLSHAR